MSDSPIWAVEESTVDRPDSTPLSLTAGQPLNEKDFQWLESSSWIDRETATLARLRRVDTFAATEMLGRNDGARRNYAGVVFPYFLPGREYPHTYRIRRDDPEYEMGRDGHPKEVNKYLSPPGTRNRLYFTPKTRPEDLENIELPLIITEGEKKALSLFRLAQYDGSTPGFLAIGIAGVWNWRGITGKSVNAKGERIDTTGVIADFGLITLPGRLVLVVFDADCRTNTHVASARAGLKRELRRRGAIPRSFEMPEVGA